MTPEILTTGIGSVPFTDAETAVAHVFASYDIPFFPQLPALSPDRDVAPPMLREALTAPMVAALRRKDVDAMRRALAAGIADVDLRLALIKSQPAFPPFLMRLAGASRLKLQLIGPLTFARLALNDDALTDAACRWIEALTKTWVTLVHQSFRGPILFLWDDGLLATAAGDAARRFAESREKLSKHDAILGLHTCAPGKFSDIVANHPKALLALDLAAIPFRDDADRRAVAKHLDSGGRFVFGVADTQRRDIEPAGIRGAVAEARALTDGHTDRPLVISGGCGTGLHSVPYERALAAALRDVKRPN